MVASSLDLLEESLVKKIAVLDKIEEQTQRQKEVLQDPEKVDEAAFDETVNAKSELIDQILLLDEGFQSLFDKVKAEVEGNKDRYADQIKKMQDLIQEITGRSASIEANERRNRALAEKYFSTAREKMHQSRSSSSAAFNYYQTMNNFKNIPPQFMDKKN